MLNFESTSGSQIKESIYKGIGIESKRSQYFIHSTHTDQFLNIITFC